MRGSCHGYQCGLNADTVFRGLDRLRCWLTNDKTRTSLSQPPLHWFAVVQTHPTRRTLWCISSAVFSLLHSFETINPVVVPFGSKFFQVTSLPPPSFITFGCWAVFFFFLSYLSFYWRADGGSNCHVCKEMCSLIVLTVCISPILSWLRLKDSPQTVEQYCWPVTLNCSFTKPSSNGECTTVWWHVSQSIHWSLHHFDILVKNRLVHSKFCLSNQGIGE